MLSKLFNWLFRSRKYKITLLAKNWSVIKDGIHVKSIPSKDELIFIQEFNKYYTVFNVIHAYSENNNDGVFVIITELIKTPEKKII